MNTPSRRPGRPATENLGRFYLSTGLLAHPKALRLRRELALEEREVFLLVSRLFEFAATFAGSSGHIPRSDYGALSAFCFWDGDPFLLVSAFRRAGFIDNEGDVHGWLEFQPDALKRASRRKKTTGVQEVDTSTEALESTPGIMEDKITHNSTEATPSPEGIMENNTHQNSESSQVADFSEQSKNGNFLERNLLSQRESSNATVILPAHARERASEGKSELAAKVEALLTDLATRSGQGGQKLGPLAHLAELAFTWAGIPEPSAGQLARLRLAVAQIGPEGVERLVRDFEERGYEPTDKLAALCGAARREFEESPENRPPAAQDGQTPPEEGK